MPPLTHPGGSPRGTALVNSVGEMDKEGSVRCLPSVHWALTMAPELAELMEGTLTEPLLGARTGDMVTKRQTSFLLLWDLWSFYGQEN